MFEPQLCPHADCPRHSDPGERRFFERHGYYEAKCRAHRIPRFRCGTCRRTFSRQTFRQDYRDHRPDLNALVLVQLVSGTGLRQTARIIGSHRHTVMLKFRKMGLQLEHLNRNLQREIRARSVTLLMDEFESFEGRRNTRPVTVPMLIEKESDFIIASRSAPIRPHGTMTEARKRAISRDRERYGARRNRSKAAVRIVLGQGARLCAKVETITVRTDEKTSYPGLIRRVFGSERVTHERTNSRVARDTFNPLFRINHAEAMARDLNGRLRRDSWLASKTFKRLDLQLAVYMAHKNYIRPRFNRDRRTPAQFLGLCDRRISPTELLAWRQDLGSATLHPFDARGRVLLAALGS